MMLVQSAQAAFIPLPPLLPLACPVCLRVQGAAAAAPLSRLWLTPATPWCLPSSACVYKALFRGEHVAAKEVDLGRSPAVQAAFLTVGGAA